MSSSSVPLPREVPVLIAGAGPTGLTLAAALAARGVEALVCEAAPGPGRESSRASTVHAGSLELLDELGLGRRLADMGARSSRSRIFRDGRLLVVQDWTRLASPYPFMANIPQAEIESVLRERLEELHGGIRFGFSVAAHQQGEGGVAVDVFDGAETRTVHCQVLVGCDGAHSAVRDALDLPLEGRTYPGVFALADAQVKADFEPDSTYLGSCRGALLGFLPLPGGRWRINATLDPEEANEPIDFERLARERLPDHGIRIAAVESSSLYTIHRRSSDAMRRGRVFLAGDAAQLSSPIGGQGMNRGIRDAFDLAWRLARALSRGSDATSFDREEDSFAQWERGRKADAARVLAGTDRLTRIMRARGPGGIAVDTLVRMGSRLPSVHDRIGAQLAGLDDARRISARYRSGA